MPYSPSTSSDTTDLAFLKHFIMLAPGRDQKLWRTLIPPKYHVPLSCHFISVMTHRFSIYATNCIGAGCWPSQSHAGPAVHLGKRRWLKMTWKSKENFRFTAPTNRKQPASLTGFPALLPCVRGGKNGSNRWLHGRRLTHFHTLISG